MKTAKATVARSSEPKTDGVSGFLRKERRWAPELEAAERDAPIVLFDLTRVPVYPPGGRPAGRAGGGWREAEGRDVGLLQAKLEVGSVDDPLEREADQVAEKVLRMPDPTAVGTPGASVTAAGARLSRKCAGCEEEDEETGGAGAAARGAGVTAGLAEAPPIVEQALGAGGRPLDAGTRAYFEPRFGFDLSKVRIHTDARAEVSARAVNALAYTVGQNIVFGQGRYTPGEPEGRRLLAHELAHVAQQRAPGAGRVAEQVPGDGRGSIAFSALARKNSRASATRPPMYARSETARSSMAHV